MSEAFLEKCKTLSDAQIVALINSGEYIYIGAIIDRYTPLIKSIISKSSESLLDFDDLFQEATLALFSAVKSFDPSKASFSTFATLCINRAVNDQVRIASAGKRVPEKLITPIEDVDIADSSSPESILIEKESYLRLADSIKLELSELEYRVLCSFLKGNSYSDISDELGLPLKSVDNALGRIRRKLKDM